MSRKDRQKERCAVLHKILWVIAATCFFMAAPAVAMASDYALVVNGISIYTDVLPKVEGPEILVPLRAVAEATGASVQYIDPEKKLIINKSEIDVILWIDNYSAIKNGSPIVLTSPPKLINDRTFVTREELGQLLDVEIYLNVLGNSVVVQD